MSRDHALAQILEEFRRVPYENVSKIFRLGMAPEQRLAMDGELFLNYYRNSWGGTCFSMSWAGLNLLRENGIGAWPVRAPMKRAGFPHFAMVYEYEGKKYFFDPGYMIFEGLPLQEDGVVSYSNGVLDYILDREREGEMYGLYSIQDGQKRLRYHIDPAPVSDREFEAAWSASFGSIQEPVLSRISGRKFVYVHGDYAQVRTRGTTERHEGREKSERIIQKYFPFRAEELQLARELLELNREGQKSDKDRVTG